MFSLSMSYKLAKWELYLTIQPISKKWPVTAQLKSLNLIKKKSTTNDVGNRVPGLGQAHKCDGDQPVNDIPTLASLIIWSATATFNDLIFGVLTTLSTIFQLYHGDQF
jgi:hypothetical protein